jgi:phage host-nuclease inhibitor protein Gam
MVAVKKKAPIAVPQSYASANALLEQLGETDREIVRTDARLAKAVARITARIELTAKPLLERKAMLVAQIAAYAEAHRDELLEGDRKSHDMPAGRIGWRANPASVEYKRGAKVADIVANILAAGLRRKFLRMKLEPNKDAMLEEENREKAAAIPGIKIITDAETFYLEPISPGLSKGAP